MTSPTPTDRLTQIEPKILDVTLSEWIDYWTEGKEAQWQQDFHFAAGNPVVSTLEMCAAARAMKKLLELVASQAAEITRLGAERDEHKKARHLLASDLVALGEGRPVETHLASVVELRMKMDARTIEAKSENLAALEKFVTDQAPIESIRRDTTERWIAEKFAELRKDNAALRAERDAARRDHLDFLAFMAADLALLPCMHDPGGHEGTAPMLWPELIRCIIARAVKDAQDRTTEGATDGHV